MVPGVGTLDPGHAPRALPPKRVAHVPSTCVHATCTLATCRQGADDVSRPPADKAGPLPADLKPMPCHALGMDCKTLGPPASDLAKCVLCGMQYKVCIQPPVGRTNDSLQVQNKEQQGPNADRHKSDQKYVVITVQAIHCNRVPRNACTLFTPCRCALLHRIP